MTLSASHSFAWTPRWQARDEALTAAGMLAQGAKAHALLARLQQLASAGNSLTQFRVLLWRDMLLLLGAADQLPWLDGARYCAPCPQAPALWLPTHLVPDMAGDLLQTALLARAGTSPLLLWHDPLQILPLSSARQLHTEMLPWLASQLAP
ncbi:MAG: hypothetical protein HYZ45_02440 [Burkholderiales bacterium]|nr:hypothetical protein [Burkholderiales bacterium]